MKIWYYGFGPTDEEDEENAGFIVCTPEAEKKAAEEAGAPTEGVVFLKTEPEDRDDTLVTVEATPAFIEWLNKEGITWDTEGA